MAGVDLRFVGRNLKNTGHACLSGACVCQSLVASTTGCAASHSEQMTTATITELKTESARLKALDARRELDEATAQTRRADDLLRAALAVRALLADVLRTVPARLA